MPNAEGSSSAVVMILVEPTSYDIDRIKNIKKSWNGTLRVFYISNNLSQPWDFSAHCIEGKLLPRNIFKKLRKLFKTIGALKKPAVVHLQGWYPYVMLICFAVAKIRQLPVVMESDTSSSRAKGIVKLIKKVTYPFIFRRVSHFAPGGSKQAQYLRNFGVLPEKMTIVQMSVDVNSMLKFNQVSGEKLRAAVRARYGVQQNEILVLFLARLEPEKGVEDLLGAFKRISNWHRIKMLVVGDGSLAGAVTRAAIADDRILGVGRLSGKDVWHSYMAADIFVLPSRFEPWGLVVNEAMAFGLPVIASDSVGCCDDLIEDGNTGLIFKTNDKNDLAERIIALYNNPERRKAMGAKAQALISTWTIENEAKRIICVWEKCLKN